MGNIILPPHLQPKPQAISFDVFAASVHRIAPDVELTLLNDGKQEQIGLSLRGERLMVIPASEGNAIVTVATTIQKVFEIGQVEILGEKHANKPDEIPETPDQGINCTPVVEQGEK